MWRVKSVRELRGEGVAPDVNRDSGTTLQIAVRVGLEVCLSFASVSQRTGTAVAVRVPNAVWTEALRLSGPKAGVSPTEIKRQAATGGDAFVLSAAGVSAVLLVPPVRGPVVAVRLDPVGQEPEPVHCCVVGGCYSADSWCWEACGWYPGTCPPSGSCGPCPRDRALGLGPDPRLVDPRVSVELSRIDWQAQSAVVHWWLP